MTVYLVGAGPGDPDLLTRRGAALLAEADVVIVDRLADSRLLDEVRDDALVINVGKHPRDGARSVSQEEINELLITHGRTATCVVRLKGGDPFVFGRGGEEVIALRSAGVRVEVVPGISSAFAVPALAGIPVTHRGLSTSVTVVSGHDVSDTKLFEDIGRTSATVVVLMGVENRASIAAALQRGGRSAATPAAAIEWGSTPRERTVQTTLGKLGDISLAAPAVLIIGDVAALGDEMGR